MANWLALALVLLAAFLDIFANIFLAASRGFRRVWLGVLAYLCVGAAFYCLSLAVKTMDLAVAYATWGAFGIIGTSLGGWIVFRQKLNIYAWLGMIVLVLGIFLLH